MKRIFSFFVFLFMLGVVAAQQPKAVPVEGFQMVNPFDLLDDLFYTNKPKPDASLFEQIKASAEKGDAESQFKLGSLYEFTTNSAKGIEWFRKTAEQGHIMAQNWLGYKYYNGDGVAKDIPQAVEWYYKSAKQGRAQAENDLGVCCMNGQWELNGKETAVKLFKAAANQGLNYAQYNLALCYYGGIGLPIKLC